MEAYKTTCPDCGQVRFRTGYKSGIGKTEEQLEQMEVERATCTRCGSRACITELDHESPDGRVLDAQAKLLASYLGELLSRRS